MSFTKPKEVFTPRLSAINNNMYISRPDSEKSLLRALEGTQHVVIHGDSGSGKTWLCQKVLKDNQISFLTVNLANASRFGSITTAIQRTLESLGERKKIEQTEMKGAEASAYFAKGTLEVTTKFEVGNKEPLHAAFEYIRSIAHSETAILWLDNLESIFSNPNHMHELGDIITLLDDPIYSNYKVKLLLVGVPGEIKEYFNKAANRQTIANRLYELPEIAPLDENKIKDFLLRGFKKELRYTLNDEDIVPITKHITWVTIGIPQRLHEYCLELAYLAEDSNSIVKTGLLTNCDSRWIQSSFSKDFVTIQDLMNERDTKAGRRNQTLYALGKTDSIYIRISDVEDIVRKEFPTSTQNAKLNISQVLSELSNANNPIIKRSPKGDAYLFVDPRFRMCIRAMLFKNQENEKVSLINSIKPNQQ